jgi:ABC-type polysaccharide/polyol phosphate export permease
MARPTDRMRSIEGGVAAAPTALAARPWVETKARGWYVPKVDFDELWAYRDVGWILALRDLKVRYKQTFFGVVWALIQPLLAMVVFTIIFGRGVGVPSQGVPYAAFVLAGLAVWFPFNTALTSAAESLVRNPELITKVYFPRLMAPLAAVLAPVLDLVIALAIAVVVALIAGVSVGPAVLLLPVWCVCAVVVSLAFSVWLSALNVLYRDVRYALGFTMQLLFFLSPAVYPASLTGTGWGHYLYAANPLVGLMGVVRWSILGVPAPSAGVLAMSTATTLLLLVSGVLFFRHAERQFADRV